MAENPLCPDCKKQMTVRYVCTHCGYDIQRIQTASNRKVAVMPYECVKCDAPTAKVIDGIPVCGDCFVKGWGRLPDMSLSPIGETEKIIETIGTPEAPLYVSDKPPKPKKVRHKKKSKHGGKR